MVLKQYQIFIQRRITMIYVGIDVAKDKHDCFTQTLMEKYFLSLLPSQTIVKVLKPCFKESNLYQMI